MGYRRTFFRIVYRSIYVLLYVLLFALLLVTPADAVERSLRNEQNYNVWILAICYIATILIVICIYALRLYVNKTVLSSIPKTWVPIDRSDLKKAVYKMIQAGLNRNALIAYEARPRVKTHEEMLQRDQQVLQQAETQTRTPGILSRVSTAPEDLGSLFPPPRPPWGTIEHPGWASPTAPDLPNLQYATVLSELPNLIEAKALMLAPTDPMSQTDPPTLDAEAVALLRRRPSTHLRGYLDHLVSLGVLNHSDTTTDFLAKYEHARFSTWAINNARFQEIMNLFADILRSMRPLDPDTLDSFRGPDDDDSWAQSESDIDDHAPNETNPSTPGGPLSRSATLSTQGSVKRPARNSSAQTWRNYRTAPTSPGSKQLKRYSSGSSAGSFAQTRRPYPVNQPSTSSLRSKLSDDSRSVIRLATQQDSEGLPFVITLKPTAGS
ncbi:hypothetical protein S40288_00570 [Stachybotrys chartarum IBT 40288]|nr:hypothetical protein S40288_00570 [Stachybotrys chartarum IBT 40288]